MGSIGPGHLLPSQAVRKGFTRKGMLELVPEGDGMGEDPEGRLLQV